MALEVISDLDITHFEYTAPEAAMVQQFTDIPKDLVIKLRNASGQPRYLAINSVTKTGDDLVGLHFGHLLSVPVSDVVSVVATMSGSQFDLKTLLLLH